MALNEELAIRAKDGDQAALFALWEQVERFANMKAGIFKRKYDLVRHASFELDDLVQTSYLALTEAVRYFDPEKGSFLKACDFFLKNTFAIVAGFRSKSDAFQHAASPDAPIGSDEETESLIDFVPDTTAGPEDLTVHEMWIAQLHDKLEAALGTLPENQGEVLRQRYYDCKTQENIAAAFGCTRSQIGQLEKKGLEHLRWSGSLRIGKTSGGVLQKVATTAGRENR